MTLSTAAYPVAVFFVGEGISGGTAPHFSKIISPLSNFSPIILVSIGKGMSIIC
jgi:hypothetical protein